MLKKAGNIVLILLLLISTGGVNIYRHYCGSVLMKETILLIPAPCCTGPCKCCHNESQHFRVTDNFEASSLTLAFKTQISKIFDHSLFREPLITSGIPTLPCTFRAQAVKPRDPGSLAAADKEARLQNFRL